ncbi:MAG: hypothetical protein ABIR09_08735 [Gallionella sp.]
MSENIFVMLVVEKFFQTFTGKLDEVVRKAVAAGGHRREAAKSELHVQAWL